MPRAKPQTNLARSVDAIFGGKSVTFYIGRGAEPWLNVIGVRPYRVLQHFLTDLWTLDELRVVLRIAYPGEGWSITPNEADRVLDTEPPARYVPLAVKVLQAWLFGLAPEASTWDERDPFPETDEAVA